MFEKLFKFSERKASLKNEIIGGIVTFIAMCYILPINASILGQAGMSFAGVFAITALLSFVVTMIMGLVANYPLVLSAGMGLNAYFTYTLCMSAGFEWYESMMILTLAGAIFFVLSLTPVRKLIIEAIPADLKATISCALGVFIAFVGLRNSGIVVASSTLVSLGNFADPAMLIAIIAVVVGFGLMFAKNKIVSSLAIPIAIVLAAAAGVIVSVILCNNGQLAFVDAHGLVEGDAPILVDGELVGFEASTQAWRYVMEGSSIHLAESKLPIAPWIAGDQFGLNGLQDVFLYGLFSSNKAEGYDLGKSFIKIISSPATYVAIFSLIFVNLFDTTATLLTVGKNIGLFNEKGEMQNYRRAVLADATGALVCGPLGTSTVTSFAESNIGVSLGAKTGLSACVAALFFLASAFLYPIFSIFTAGSVTAAALVCVGCMIFVGNIKDINFKDGVAGFTAAITILFALLTYSIATGIGIGLICYVVMMLISGRAKEVKLPIYIVAGLFVVSFVMDTIMPLIS